MINYILYQIYNLQVWFLRVSGCGDEWGYSSNFYDEKENNYRKILNFGHTFAHAFESARNFSKNLNHGKAVLIGMMCACEFAFEKKILKKEDFNIIKNHYKKFNLPKNIKNYFEKEDVDKIVKFMKSDKKNYNNKINLIIIKKNRTNP